METEQERSNRLNHDTDSTIRERGVDGVTYEDDDEEEEEKGEE